MSKKANLANPFQPQKTSRLPLTTPELVALLSQPPLCSTIEDYHIYAEHYRTNGVKHTSSNSGERRDLRQGKRFRVWIVKYGKIYDQSKGYAKGSLSGDVTHEDLRTAARLALAAASVEIPPELAE